MRQRQLMSGSSSIGLLLLILTQTAATAAIAAVTTYPELEPEETEAPTRTQTSTGTQTHTIKVGPREDPHQYVPKETDANIGDTILFEFYPRNHSVVQADFLVPCIPRAGGFFDSGNFNEFDEKDGQLVGEPPTWSMVIRTEEPLFFYCTAIDSCIDNGMVGVINPNSSQTWASQYKKALEYPYQLSPGESPPAEGEDKDEDSDDSSDDSDSDSSVTLSGGAIAGIVVGVVAAIGVLGVLFFVLGRNRVYRKWLTSEDGTHSRTARWALTGGASTTGGGAGGGGGTGAWSTAGDTMRQTDVTTPHPGHLSYMTSDMPHGGHLSMQQTPGSPPANWGWEARGAATDNGPVSPKPFMTYHDNTAPHELSAIHVAELDAGPNSPKDQQGPADGTGTGTTTTENNI